MAWIELAVIIAVIIIGIRFGGLAIGMWSGVGLLILASVIGVTPTSPPIDVLLIIFAVVIAASTLEVSGGLELLVRIAAKVIKANPKYITIVAPLVTFLFTFMAGTANIIYPLQPVIYEVAYSAGIRPERPMTTATMSGTIALAASPISAATAAFVGLFAAYNMNDFSLSSIMMVVVPSTLVATLITSFIMMFYGKDLDKDPEYQERLKKGLVQPPTPISSTRLPTSAKTSVVIFLGAVLLIMLTGFFPQLRVIPGAKSALGMSTVIEIVMLSAGALICWICKPNVNKVADSPTLRAGVISMAVIFGVCWLADSYIMFHKDSIIATLSAVVKARPWTFAVALAIVGVLIQSPAATTRAIMPLGLVLGISPWLLIAMYPASCASTILPIGGPSLSGVAFDRSGTTSIGKYFIDQSYMVPILLMVIISVSFGLAMVSFF